MARTVRVAGAIGVLSALTALTGCSIAPATAGETPATTGETPATLSELRESFASTLAETQLLLDGQWENRDDPDVRACATAVGTSGTRTPALRIATGSFDGPQTASTVAVAWGTWGYRVTVSEFDAVSEVQAQGLEGEYLILRVTDVAATLQGESACAATPTP